MKYVVNGVYMETSFISGPNSEPIRTRPILKPSSQPITLYVCDHVILIFTHLPTGSWRSNI